MPTVREILALPVVASGGPVVAGGGRHLDRPVRWVHLTESSDLKGLLQGGELVMSTGLALAQEPDRAGDYLRMLAGLQVAALVVELGTHLRRLPAGVDVLADELELPVVALTEPIPFIEVTELVHRLIVVDRYEELQFARTTHETFTSLNIARASPTDIVTRASVILEAPVVLEDLNRHVVAFCAGGAPAAILLEGWSERSRRRASEGGASDDWSEVPVGVGAQQWGRLVVPRRSVQPDRVRLVLERAAQSLQLQRMLEQDRDALLVQAWGGLLDDLVTGRTADETEAVARAASLGMSAGGCYVPLVVKVSQRPGADALAQGAVDRRVLAAARQAVASSGLTAIGSIRREGTIALLITCPSPAEVEGRLNAVCVGLALRLAGGRDVSSWAAGTAAATTGLVAAAGGLGEAEHVAEVGATMPGRKRLFRSADVRLPGLFALLRADHRVQAFAESELGHLLNHDARSGEDLTGLLRAFLARGGSKTETARATGLSRPTLYARLSTIERILGVSLGSVESRTSLHAAMMIIDTRAGPGVART